MLKSENKRNNFNPVINLWLYLRAIALYLYNSAMHLDCKHSSLFHSIAYLMMKDVFLSHLSDECWSENEEKNEEYLFFHSLTVSLQK